jgi:histidine ammonia-lyase
MTIAVSGNDLSFEQLYAVALRGEKVALTADAVERMKASRAVVDRVVASGATAYGINTGFQPSRCASFR